MLVWLLDTKNNDIHAGEIVRFECWEVDCLIGCDGMHSGSFEDEGGTQVAEVPRGHIVEDSGYDNRVHYGDGRRGHKRP